MCATPQKETKRTEMIPEGEGRDPRPNADYGPCILLAFILIITLLLVLCDPTTRALVASH